MTPRPDTCDFDSTADSDGSRRGFGDLIQLEADIVVAVVAKNFLEIEPSLSEPNGLVSSVFTLGKASTYLFSRTNSSFFIASSIAPLIYTAITQLVVDQ